MRVTVIETNIFPDPENTLAPLGEVKYLVIHHTGGNAEGTVDPDPDAATIDGWHKNQNWAGIGYHYVIRKDGSVERGRPRDFQGSHAWGLNRNSLGIHVGGDFQNFEPTAAQQESLNNLIADLCDIYGLDPAAAVIGHRDVAELIGNQEAATDCPGDNMYAKIEGVKAAVAGLLNG